MKTLYKRITNFTFAALIAISSLAALTPVLFASSANAAPGLVYQSNPTFSDLSFGPDRRAPAGSWSVSGNTLTQFVQQDNASTDPGFYRTEGVKADLGATQSISATLLVDQAWSDDSAPVRAGIWGIVGNGNSDPTDVAWPIIEFSNLSGTPVFRVFDTMVGDWTDLGITPVYGNSYKLEIAFNAATKSYDFYVSDAANANIHATVSKTAVDSGTTYGNIQGVIFNNFNSATPNADQNYTVKWNGFQTSSAPVTTACVAPTALLTTDINTWDTSRTRVNGHNAIVVGGLHIYTDGNSQTGPDGNAGTWNTDKAAGYFATNYALKDNGSQTIAESMDYTNNIENAPIPGLQLLVDFDNDASNNTVVLANGQSGDGFLVGETIFGTENWWMSEGNTTAKTGAPHHSDGTDGIPAYRAYYGTINEWLNQFPAARVSAIGYSLGSGAHGDGIINRITLGCVSYIFDLPPVVPVVPTTPATDGNDGANDGTNGAASNGGLASTPAITSASSVLGATDNTASQGNSDVAGTSDDKTATAASTNGTIFGLMWYWWLLILAVLGGIIWFIIAAIRRRNAEA